MYKIRKRRIAVEKTYLRSGEEEEQKKYLLKKRRKRIELSNTNLLKTWNRGRKKEKTYLKEQVEKRSGNTYLR